MKNRAKSPLRKSPRGLPKTPPPRRNLPADSGNSAADSLEVEAGTLQIGAGSFGVQPEVFPIAASSISLPAELAQASGLLRKPDPGWENIPPNSWNLGRAAFHSGSHLRSIHAHPKNIEAGVISPGPWVRSFAAALATLHLQPSTSHCHAL